ncbi:hypothetical protein P691DRAFT_618456, partial [Macrolepiota fuliginosa MF-IS2]
ELHTAIITGYNKDPWCTKLLTTAEDVPGITKKGDLMFFENHLIIPCPRNIRQSIYGLAHDSLGHFGF